MERLWPEKNNDVLYILTLNSYGLTGVRMIPCTISSTGTTRTAVTSIGWPMGWYWRSPSTTPPTVPRPLWKPGTLITINRYLLVYLPGHILWVLVLLPPLFFLPFSFQNVSIPPPPSFMCMLVSLVDRLCEYLFSVVTSSLRRYFCAAPFTNAIKIRFVFCFRFTVLVTLCSPVVVVHLLLVSISRNQYRLTPSSTWSCTDSVVFPVWTYASQLGRWEVIVFHVHIALVIELFLMGLAISRCQYQPKAWLLEKRTRIVG